MFSLLMSLRIPDSIVKWLPFLLHIQEVKGLNVCLETSYPDGILLYGFLSHSQQVIVP
jgi:hypothetical protein